MGLILLAIGGLLSAWLVHGRIYQVMILSAGVSVVGLLLIASGLLQRSGRYDNGFVTILNDFQDMPHTMKQLAWVQFFSWFALFAMWIYTTPAVTSHLYHTADTTSALYNEGANWVGVGFGTYNGVAAVVAFAIPLLARRTNRKIAHAICLVCGALGLLSILVLKDPRLLLGSMVGVGIAWASILAMPYAILTGSLPPSKMGYYMGVFNFFIVIPQIVAAALLGFLVGRFFGGEAIYALAIGGASLLLAAALTLRVEDKDEPETGTWHPGSPLGLFRPRPVHLRVLRASVVGGCFSWLARHGRSSSGADRRRRPSTFWNSATVYFLLTDRFENGNRGNDHALRPTARRSAAAQLRGRRSGRPSPPNRPGYFDSLGVTVIWLTPFVEQIHGGVDEGTGKTYGYHGYWTRDWTAVDPALGTKSDLRAMVDAAHRHGIRVLMDAVINHTGPVTPRIPRGRTTRVRTGPNCTYRSYATTVDCNLVATLPDIRTDRDAPVEFLRRCWRSGRARVAGDRRWPGCDASSSAPVIPGHPGTTSSSG